MALTDENGNGMVMPVQPMGYSGYGYPAMNGLNNGIFGGDGAWLILFLIAAMTGGFGFGGWGMGGFGGFGGFGGEFAFPWLLASNANNMNATQDGFNQAATANTLSSIQATMAAGFGDTALGIAGINQNICQTGGQITQAISNTAAQAEIAAQGRQSALTQQLYNNELNSLNRSFAEQTANVQAINGISRQVAEGSYENRLATQGLQAVIQSENCADRAAVKDALQALTVQMNAGFQGIHDELCQDKLNAKDQEIANLRTQVSMQNLAASQAAQTAQLVADNTAQTQYIVNRVAPYPTPSFIVPNPYAGYVYGNGGYGY